MNRRADNREIREEFETARKHGVAIRHANKLRHLRERTSAVTAKYTQCCYVKQHTHERCTGEAVDNDPTTIKLCIRHLAMAMELIQDRKRQATRRAS